MGRLLVSRAIRWRAGAPSAERPEGGSHLLGEQLQLLPGREVTALREPVVVDQVRVRALGPAPRRAVDLVWEGADTGRELDPLRREEGEFALPVQAGR